MYVLFASFIDSSEMAELVNSSPEQKEILCSMINRKGTVYGKCYKSMKVFLICVCTCSIFHSMSFRKKSFMSERVKN